MGLVLLHPSEKKINPSEVVKKAKGKKLSLQDFYEEVPDFFRPPEVKLFVQ